MIDDYKRQQAMEKAERIYKEIERMISALLRIFLVFVQNLLQHIGLAERQKDDEATQARGDIFS